MSLEDILEKLRQAKSKPSEEDLRRLPFKRAFIYGRVSTDRQVEDSRESIREIAFLAGLAQRDGYSTNLTTEEVERWLHDIQGGAERSRLLEDGDLIIDCQDLGLSGTLRENKRPGLAHLTRLMQEGKIGSVYLTEGMSRLSRDPNRVLGYQLLELLQKQSCRVRTPEAIFNPAIPRDWDVLARDVEESAEDKKVRSVRLVRRLFARAAQGLHVGAAVTPGFIVAIEGQRRDGSYIFGKWQVYPPHQEVVIIILKEYIRLRGPVLTARSLARQGITFPPFSLELRYMETRTALKSCRRTAARDYIIGPAVVTELATNPKLIGIWDWGDNLIIDNHPKAVPVELWEEAWEIATSKKPRGRAAYTDPLDWVGLLWCYNHESPRRVTASNKAGRWICPPDNALGESCCCLDVVDRIISRPLTQEFLRCLDLSPHVQAVLEGLQAQASASNLEETRRRRQESDLKARISKLEACLGSGDPEREETYWKLIKEARAQLQAIQQRPLTTPVTAVDVERVKHFLQNLEETWESFSPRLRNRLLRLLVERVELRHRWPHIQAIIVWKTGFQQVIEIERPITPFSLEKRWTAEEEGSLRLLWPSSPAEIVRAAFPQRSWLSLAGKAAILGLHRKARKKLARPGRPWSQEEKEELQRLYPTNMPVTHIAKALGRSFVSVKSMASERKVIRPPEVKRRKLEPIWWPATISSFQAGTLHCR